MGFALHYTTLSNEQQSVPEAEEFEEESTSRGESLTYFDGIRRIRKSPARTLKVGSFGLAPGRLSLFSLTVDDDYLNFRRSIDRSLGRLVARSVGRSDIDETRTDLAGN